MSSSHCQQLWLFPSFVEMDSSTSLSIFVILPSEPPIGSNEVFGNLLKWLHRIMFWVVAVPAHDASSVIALAHMVHNAIDCEFALRVSEFFSGTLSSAIADSVISFVNLFFWHVNELPLCEFSEGASVARLIETVSPFWSFLNVIVVGDTYITINGPALEENRLFYDSVSKLSAAEVFIGGWSR